MIAKVKKKKPNPLRSDPTRQATLRRLFVKEFVHRFERIRKKVMRLIIDQNAFGLGQDNGLTRTANTFEAGGREHKETSIFQQQPSQADSTFKDASHGLTTNLFPIEVSHRETTTGDENTIRNQPSIGDSIWIRNAGRWKSLSDPDKQKEFEKWLQQQVEVDVLGGGEATINDYWRKYSEEAFQKGQGRAYNDYKKAALAKDPSRFAGGREQFLESSFGRPVNIEKLKQLSGQVFTDLKHVTKVMSDQMSDILVQGLAQGMNPNKIARLLANRVDKIGKTRATVIARTEITRSHAEGQLSAFEELGVEKLGVQSEWSTAGDTRVCPLCQPLEGTLFTIKEARGAIPRHAQCRCAWIPANVGESKLTKDRRKVEFTNPNTGKVQIKQPSVKDTQDKIEGAISRSIAAEIPKKGARTLAKQKELTKWPGVDIKITKKRPVGLIDDVTEVDIRPTGKLPKSVKKKSVKVDTSIKKADDLVAKGLAEREAARKKLEAKLKSTIPKPKSKKITTKTTKPKPTKKSSIKTKEKVLPRVEDNTVKSLRDNYGIDVSKGTMGDPSTRRKAIKELASESERLSKEFPGIKRYMKKGDKEDLAFFTNKLDNTRAGVYLPQEKSTILNIDLRRGFSELRTGTHQIGTRLRDVHRHEYGHRFFEKAIDKSKQKKWEGLAKKYTVDASGKYPKNLPVSRYAATNSDELFAESFSAFTHKDYKAGMLPKDLEDFVIGVLK